MADLFADLSARLPAKGSEGEWEWREGPASMVEVWYHGRYVAALWGPDRYDYLVRLMVAEPPRSE